MTFLVKRVRWSAYGLQQCRPRCPRDGDFIKDATDGCVYVRWDGNRTHTMIHHSFVDIFERDEESESVT